MTVGGTLVPAIALAWAAVSLGTRDIGSGVGRPITGGIVGAVAQAALMLWVIAMAMMLSARSS